MVAQEVIIQTGVRMGRALATFDEAEERAVTSAPDVTLNRCKALEALA
jgi:hypothetical protein